MDKEERENLVTYSAIFIHLAVVILPIVGLLVISQLGPYIYLIGIFATDKEPQYRVTCDTYDRTIKTEWLASNNITGYEDIPEAQKRNPSNDTKEELKGIPSGWFNATNYSDLSTPEKESFKKALDDGTRVKNRSKTPPYPRVFYNGEVYLCDTTQIGEGA